MRAITIEDLNAAAHIGGAGSLVMRQELEPASGPDGVIAPAKYTMEKVATYIYPRVIRAGSRATVYRNKGNVQNKKKPKDKVSPAEAYIATAYEQYPESGMLLTWAWHENPSPEVFKTLNLLCDEVPYLGEACSVVELHAHEDYVFPAAAEDCVWTLSSDSALGSIFRKGRPLSFPRRGRLDDLKKAFVAANPAPKGKKRAASISDKEDEQNFLNEYLPLQTEGQARYIPPSAQKEDALKAPWATAFYLEIDRVDGKQGDDGKAEWRPEESELVGWAVALHRFLVKQWGPDPSLALIGKYAPGMSRPANNVSIQILDSGFKLAYAQKLRKELTGKGPGFLNGNVGLLYASEAEERQLPKATVDPHSNMAIVNRWKKTSFLQNLKDNGKHPFQTRSEKNDAKLNCRRRELFTQNKNRKGGLPQE